MANESKPTPYRGHEHPGGVIGFIGSVLHLPGFDHDHGETDSVVVDKAVLDNNIGIITIWLSLGLLWVTTVFQAFIYTRTDSVALLADTVHNLVDALNSIPLLIAFYFARRPATRRFTYGFGRAEDIAGILIVVSIVYSAFHIINESIARFLNPTPIENLGLVAVAAAIGFIGNEAVAILQIRVGKRIGSDAMVADGNHARIDGITSLAVFVAVVGSAIGLDILDPIIGVVIAVAIVGIAWNAVRKVWFRLMDAVDPSIFNQFEHHIEQVAGVNTIERLRIRWVGHRLYSEVTVTGGDSISVAETHAISERIKERLDQVFPVLGEVTVHVAPSYIYGREDESSPAGDGSAPFGLQNMLPPRYAGSTPSAAPMGAASIVLDNDGNAAWNEIWTDFCDLALAGGPPHRGSLLEPIKPEEAEADPEAYEKVLAELERGIQMVTGLETVRSETPGWVGMKCDSEEMALWLLRAIVVENITVRREGPVLYFPAGPNFKLEKEIKNVVTVVAKTNHYWKEHLTGATIKEAQFPG
ncbi:MAG: cation diffusion facilitator family transporter [Chloroflexota bacterium]